MVILLTDSHYLLCTNCWLFAPLHMKYSWLCNAEKESNDWQSFTHLFQLVTSMTEEVLLSISHLLLTVKTKHAGHQHRHSILSPVASGCTIHGWALAPGTNSLPWNKWVRQDLCLIKGHWMVKLILQQVDLSQHLLQPKVPQWDRILWP